jgi:hypothetical protein
VYAIAFTFDGEVGEPSVRAATWYAALKRNVKRKKTLVTIKERMVLFLNIPKV